MSTALGDRQVRLTVVVEREDDGRWIAEVPELPGVLVYGATEAEAMAKAEVLALRAFAERIEHGEAQPVPIQIVLPAADAGTHSQAYGIGAD